MKLDLIKRGIQYSLNSPYSPHLLPCPHSQLLSSKRHLTLSPPTLACPPPQHPSPSPSPTPPKKKNGRVGESEGDGWRSGGMHSVGGTEVALHAWRRVSQNAESGEGPMLMGRIRWPKRLLYRHFINCTRNCNCTKLEIVWVAKRTNCEMSTVF